MPEITDAQVQALVDAAEKATPGPWYHQQAGVEVPPRMRPPDTYDWISEHPVAGLHRKIVVGRGAFYGGTEDYAFVAAADPPTILALAARMRAAERAAWDLEQGIGRALLSVQDGMTPWEAYVALSQAANKLIRPDAVIALAGEPVPQGGDPNDDAGP